MWTMNISQWKKLKRSGAFRNKVKKVYNKLIDQSNLSSNDESNYNNETSNPIKKNTELINSNSNDVIDITNSMNIVDETRNNWFNER